MKAIIVLISFLAITTASPWQSRNVARHYDPEEERADRISFFLWEDEAGQLQVENLINATLQVKGVDASDITLYLYTKDNPLYWEDIKPTDFRTMSQSVFYEKRRKNVFLIHGWNNNYESKVNTLLRDALLSRFDLNVFVVDWSGPANKNYFSAKNAVPNIGDALGDFINEMIAYYGSSSKDFNLIGHSLGAHIAGRAGSQIAGKINWIIGLDPASPLFSLSNTDERLDPSDADFVQIVHTSSLGFSSAIGHADYYPNGGTKQPGCGFDIAMTCAHSRSYFYLAESFQHYEFIAHLCESFNDYDNGNCTDNHESFLGDYHIDKSAYGDYYLRTNNEEPFAINSK